MPTPSRKYQLTNLATGKSSEMEALSPSVGPDVLNIAPLYRDHGLFTFDPGFMSTASTESKVTYIDGDKGILLYRGYPIEQLAAKSSFIEVAYLLIYGELPPSSVWPSSAAATISHRTTSHWPTPCATVSNATWAIARVAPCACSRTCVTAATSSIR